MNAAAQGQPDGGSIAKGQTMTLPPLQFSSSSSAKSGDIGQTLGFDHSGFTVNYGSGVSQGGALPAVNPLVLGAIVVLGLVWMRKKST